MGVGGGGGGESVPDDKNSITKIFNTAKQNKNNMKIKDF